MYMRVTKSGGHEYVALAHNYRDPESRRPKAEVLYNFGRRDRLDTVALERLVESINRFLRPEEARERREDGSLVQVLEFLGSKRLGGTLVLDGMWRRLGVQEVLLRLLGERSFRTPVERLLFALVAQRALNPGSKLALASWVADEVHVDGLERVDVQQLYRAMDFLLGAHDEIQREVFWSVSNLFNLEVDVLLIDTTNTYFEIDREDADELRNDDDGGNGAGDDAVGDDAVGGDGAALGGEDAGSLHAGLRKRGRSKDHRSGYPQAVIGFAVTKDGIPVRCWVWPGNTSDQSVIAEVKRDLNAWKLGRIVTVLDTGFNSAANRRTLAGAGDAFIIGEKMRLGKDGKPPEALARAGRYKELENGLRVKEVITQSGSVKARRFVIVHDPEEAKGDAARRHEIVRETERRLAELEQLAGDAHSQGACALRSHKAFGRYLQQAKGGVLRLNKAKIAREAKLDGKFLVSTNDDHLTSEEVALGYKQLHLIERVNRDLKSTVDVRPVYHRLEERIRAHVLLCWLALLLIRVIENETEQTWPQLKRALAPLSVAHQGSPYGRVLQTNALNNVQKGVLNKLKLKAPPQFLELPIPLKNQAQRG